jgi:hypothetical protein
MRYRKLTSSGDFTFGTSADYYVNNPEAVAQAVKTRLELWEGEWFLDVTEGTPYATEVLGEHTQLLYDMAIRNRILGTQGVIGIEDYASDLNRETRALSIRATISTIYGQVQLEQML